MRLDGSNLEIDVKPANLQRSSLGKGIIGSSRDLFFGENFLYSPDAQLQQKAIPTPLLDRFRRRLQALLRLNLLQKPKLLH